MTRRRQDSLAPRADGQPSASATTPPPPPPSPSLLHRRGDFQRQACQQPGECDRFRDRVPRSDQSLAWQADPLKVPHWRRRRRRILLLAGGADSSSGGGGGPFSSAAAEDHLSRRRGRLSFLGGDGGSSDSMAASSPLTRRRRRGRHLILGCRGGSSFSEGWAGGSFSFVARAAALLRRRWLLGCLVHRVGGGSSSLTDAEAPFFLGCGCDSSSSAAAAAPDRWRRQRHPLLDGGVSSSSLQGLDAADVSLSVLPLPTASLS